MVCFQTPPGRTSISSIVMLKPSGPHQFTRCVGLVIACHTSSRGASRIRVKTISRSAVLSAGLLFVSAMMLLLFFQFLQIGVEAIQALLPDNSILFHPIRNLLKRLGFQAAGTPLRLAPPRDQPSPLEHFQVLRDRGHAHVKGLG